jgi:hypothetical protein
MREVETGRRQFGECHGFLLGNASLLRYLPNKTRDRLDNCNHLALVKRSKGKCGIAIYGTHQSSSLMPTL